MISRLAIAVAVAVAVGTGVFGASVPGPPPSPREPSWRRLAPPDRPVLPAAVPPAHTDSLPPRFEPIRWRRSRTLGLPWSGRLVGGVRLPATGVRFFTWDPVLRRSPNRGWRRVGSDRLVRVLLQVLTEFAAAHPRAPRIGVGDLSRPSGGDFGARYGLPGHASHQNGLDVDLYYPRLDRRELPPRRVVQIDRGLSQDLVDRFVRAGAKHVFIGPSTRLAGPSSIVQRLAHHDNHLHVRLR